LILLAGLAIARPAWADGYIFPIDIESGSLTTSLQSLMHQANVELLFDRNILRDRKSTGLRGRLSVEAALQRLLSGSNLAARRAASGAWIVEQQPGADKTLPDDLTTPDILVVGRRTQDVDIRRRENDIQPYQVATGDQITSAHRDNLDQYFASRVTANTVVSPPSLGQSGQTNSQIDLRGLGAEQTLILVDGRRMPGIPQTILNYLQPDINAIPLHAIDRVETLTGSASGIYGFGALGGVVNIVLRHDVQGVELHGTAGISSRGDSRRLSLEGGFGFSPDDGRTDVMVFASRSWEKPLLEGQRGYALRGREQGDKVDPAGLEGVASIFTSNSVNVYSFDFDGAPLVLKREYGGVALSADHTFLSRGFAGTAADLAAALIQNSGKVDLSPSTDQNASDLGSTPSTISAILDLRHKFGGGIEAYFNGLILRNRGRYDGRESDGAMALFADSPLNPFQNTIWVTFPALAEQQYARIRFASDRYTGGIIAPLPFQWKATAEATFGAVHYDANIGTRGYYNGPLTPDGTESPDFNPFGNWDAFQHSLAAYQLDTSLTEHSYNRYREQALRLAGPACRTAAGPATLTLLAQNRTEAVPSFTSSLLAELYGSAISSYYAKHATATRSAYAELAAPLIAQDAAMPLLKGLQLQLAVRYDRQKVAFAPDPSVVDAPEELHARFAGTTFTAGAKFFPLPWLMLRGSYATGEQPPPLDKLIDNQSTDYLLFLTDPKRGNAILSDFGQYTLKSGGSPDLTTLRASTLALGMVFNPRGVRGPRVSIDYSHIHRIGDYVALDSDTVLAHEDYWPQRVTRAPLTDDDRALGYTAGEITMIDARGLNAGRLDVATIDGRLDWTMPVGGGTLRTTGAATVELRDSAKALFAPAVEQAGYVSGPLKWRANGGAEWIVGRTMIGTNVQYFSRYRIIDAAAVSVAYISETPQGSKYVKAQAYVDLYASRRLPIYWGGRDHPLSLDLAVINLFDHAPPYQANSSFLGSLVSQYGDPRRRRFELTLNASF
jgi:outer membrane receptor protein involved in Fe transport